MAAYAEEVPINDQHGHMYRSRDNEDRKLFLGGLSWDTDEGDIHSYFSRYGQVDQVSIKYDAVTGKPRGFGFVTFSSIQPIDAILESGPHVIKNRAVEAKRPRAKNPFGCKKIFVGGVDADIPEEDIKQYFSRFGSVEGIECPYDRQRGRRREFCFVIFENEEAAEAAVAQPKQVIGNKECDIKKAQPQRGHNFGQSQGNGFGGGGGRQRGWNNSYGGDSRAWSGHGSGFGDHFGNQTGYRKTYTNSNFYPSNY